MSFYGMAVYADDDEPKAKKVVIKNRPWWLPSCLWAWLLGKLVRLEDGE